MFLNWTFSFLIFFTAFSAHAYSNAGVERITPAIIEKLAEKENLGIPSEERSIKSSLLKLKKKHGKDFKEKLGDNLENPDYYQGYLLEIQDGLTKIEKAKKIAKYEIYKKIQKNWNDIKMTSLNVNADKTFKQFRVTLIRDLNAKFAYLGTKSKDKTAGFHFEIRQWGYVTVSPALKTVSWKIAFNDLHDDNHLEKGAEDIKIDTNSSGSGDSGTGGDDSAPQDLGN